MCDIWQAMCVTHGMPCVNMHGSFEAYIRGFTWAVGRRKGAQLQSMGAARRRRRKGKEKGRKERRKGGKERRKERRKEKKKGEEERKRKECCAVSRPGRQRT